LKEKEKEKRRKYRHLFFFFFFFFLSRKRRRNSNNNSNNNNNREPSQGSLLNSQALIKLVESYNFHEIRTVKSREIDEHEMVGIFRESGIIITPHTEMRMLTLLAKVSNLFD